MNLYSQVFVFVSCRVVFLCLFTAFNPINIVCRYVGWLFRIIFVVTVALSVYLYMVVCMSPLRLVMYLLFSYWNSYSMCCSYMYIYIYISLVVHYLFSSFLHFVYRVCSSLMCPCILIEWFVVVTFILIDICGLLVSYYFWLLWCSFI